MPAPKVTEGEAFAPDIEERHLTRLGDSIGCFLVRRPSGGESDEVCSGKFAPKTE